MKVFKNFSLILLAILGLGLAFLLYARYHPNMLVKIMGNKGGPGQLGSIHLADNRFLVVEEIIDQDEGIGVEGGTGFGVQLKKLFVYDFKTEQNYTLGLNINSRLLGCSNQIIWVFDYDKGLAGFSLKTGKTLMNGQELRNRNPGIGEKPGDFFVDESYLWLRDLSGRWWKVNNQFKAYLAEANPAVARKIYPVGSNAIGNKKGDTLLALKGDKRKQLSLGSEKGGSVFIDGFFLNHPYTGLAIQSDNPSGYFILQYKNILDEGFRITHIRESGKLIWDKNLDGLLDRKAERFLLARVYPVGEKLCLILNTNRGTRLVFLNMNSGEVLKNIAI